MKMIYHTPVVYVTGVDMEQSIAQGAPVSVRVMLDPWEEDPNPVGQNPEVEGGDFYIFYE